MKAYLAYLGLSSQLAILTAISLLLFTKHSFAEDFLGTLALQKA
jgi:hypothetical protein